MALIYLLRFEFVCNRVYLLYILFLRQFEDSVKWWIQDLIFIPLVKGKIILPIEGSLLLIVRMRLFKPSFIMKSSWFEHLHYWFWIFILSYKAGILRSQLYVINFLFYFYILLLLNLLKNFFVLKMPLMGNK